jgi:hypothetical protein
VVCFFEFLTPFTFGGYNFIVFDSFLKIIDVLDVSRGEVQILIGY